MHLSRATVAPVAAGFLAMDLTTGIASVVVATCAFELLVGVVLTLADGRCLRLVALSTTDCFGVALAAFAAARFAGAICFDLSDFDFNN